MENILIFKTEPVEKISSKCSAKPSEKFPFGIAFKSILVFQNNFQIFFFKEELFRQIQFPSEIELK